MNMKALETKYKASQKVVAAVTDAIQQTTIDEGTPDILASLGHRQRAGNFPCSLLFFYSNENK